MKISFTDEARDYIREELKNSNIDISKLKIWMYLVKLLSCGSSCIEIETDLTDKPRVGDPEKFKKIGEFEGIPIVIGPLAVETLESNYIDTLTFDVHLFPWSKPLCLVENPRTHAPRIEGYCSFSENETQFEE